MEFALDHEGISLGLCGKADLDFMHEASIARPELTNKILRAQASHRYPGGLPYPDPGNTRREEE